MAESLIRYFGPFPATSNEDGYIVGLEKLEHAALELSLLFYAHWHETLEVQLGQLHPDWQRLQDGERDGRIVLITLRKDEDMVGYFLAVIAETIAQSNIRVMTELGFYVRPEHRKLIMGSRLMTYAEMTAVKLGCKRMEMASVIMADGRNANAIYKRRGYRAASVQFVKDF